MFHFLFFLDFLRWTQLNADQSIRTTVLRQMPYRRDGFDHAVTRNVHRRRLRDLRVHSVAKSAFAIDGMEQYFAFNKVLNKSLSENFEHFKKEGIALDEALKPPFLAIPTSKKKKWSTPQFSSFELELLEMAMREFGHKIAPKMKGSTAPLAPDWASIQSRYFPHKNIRFLQCKAGRMRSSGSSKRRKNGRVKKECFGRTRAKPRRMTAEERQTLLRGIGVYGLRDWAAISRQLLPKWTRLELRKQYFRKIQPSLNKEQEMEILSKYHRHSQLDTEHLAPDTLSDPDWKVDAAGFPVLSEEEKAGVLNNEYLLQKLRTRIRAAIQSRECSVPSVVPMGTVSVDFFNPAADAHGDRHSLSDDHGLVMTPSAQIQEQFTI